MRKKQPVAAAAALSTEPTYSEAQLQPLLEALEAMKAGDFTVRMPETKNGVLSRICSAFNEVATLNEHEAEEIVRVGRLVGREGRMTERATLKNAQGSWATAGKHRRAIVDSIVGGVCLRLKSR